MSKGREFRQLLAENDYLYTTGVYNALDASIAEKVGLKCVYMSGYSTSLALLARADLGFPTMTEMVTVAEQIASNPAASLPGQTETWSDLKAAYHLFDRPEVYLLKR